MNRIVCCCGASIDSDDDGIIIYQQISQIFMNHHDECRGKFWELARTSEIVQRSLRAEDMGECSEQRL